MSPADASADVLVVGRRARGLQRRVLAGPRRARRRRPGEGRVPAREGLRRRADPARRPGAPRHGHRHLARRGLGAPQGPPGHRRRSGRRGGLAAAGPLARLQPGPPAPRARRPAGPRTRRTPAPGCTPRSPSPTRCSTTPAGSSACTPWPGRRSSRRPGARRWSSRPRGCPAGWPSRSGLVRREDRPLGIAAAPLRPHEADARRVPRHLLRPDRRGPDRATRCPATAGSSAWATGRRTSASACSTPAAAPAADHRETAAPLAGHVPRRRAARRGARRHPAARRRACPMALHRQAYTRGLLLAGDSAGHGQPVQRRGHQLRDGDRPHGGRDRRRRARRTRGARPRGGAAPLPGPVARRVRAAPPARHGLPRAARAGPTSSGSPPPTGSSGRCW